MIESILKLSDALPSGRVDKNSLVKLCREWAELEEMVSVRDRPGAYLELADVTYYVCKVLSLACAMASDAFGVTVTPDDAFDMAVAKYMLRAAPGNPKDDAAERRAIARWAGRSERPCNCGSGENWAQCPENSSYCG